MILKVLVLLTINQILAAPNKYITEEVKLKGGVIFSHEGSAQINQDFVQYTRDLDTDALKDVAQQLKDILTLYKTFCRTAQDFSHKVNTTTDKEKQIHQTTELLEYVVTPLQYPIREAPSVCRRLKARRPEIRDIHTFDKVRSVATKNNITIISAGITYDAHNHLFVYESDGKNARDHSPFPSIQYGGTYTGSAHAADWDRDSFLTDMAPAFPLVYKHPKYNFILRLADKNDRNIKENIICEKDKELTPLTYSDETNQYIQMAIHQCKRDLPALTSNTEFTLQEIRRVTTLKFTYNSNPDGWTNYLPNVDYPPDTKRKKRSLKRNKRFLTMAT